MRRCATSALIVALSGCSGAQLTYNTVDVSKTVQTLYLKQVLNNLSQTIDEPYAVPSQMDIQTGTVTTANGFTPSVTFPLTTGFTQVVNNTLNLTGSTLNKTSAMAGSGATLSGTQTWQQNWNVLPLSDANTLRNLRALYRYVVYDADIKSEYLVPRIEKNGKLSADPYMLAYPQCVLCTDKKMVNNRLKSGWLYWTSDPEIVDNARLPPPDAEVVDLGHYGNHELFMTKEDYIRGYLSDFILFVLPNAEPSDTGGGGGGGGKSSTGPRVGGAPGRPNYGFPPAPIPPISSPGG